MQNNCTVYNSRLKMYNLFNCYSAIKAHPHMLQEFLFLGSTRSSIIQVVRRSVGRSVRRSVGPSVGPLIEIQTIEDMN